MDTNPTEELSGIKGFALKVWRGGLARRVLVTRQGRILVDVPLTVVVVGGVLAPWLLGLGAVAAVVTGCQLAVRQPPPETDDEVEDEPMEELPGPDEHPLG